MNHLIERHYAVLAKRVQRHVKKEKGIVRFLDCVRSVKEMHVKWESWPKKSRRHEVVYWLESW